MGKYKKRGKGEKNNRQGEKRKGKDGWIDRCHGVKEGIKTQRGRESKRKGRDVKTRKEGRNKLMGQSWYERDPGGGRERHTETETAIRD
jgi:hypothetical protein